MTLTEKRPYMTYKSNIYVDKYLSPSRTPTKTTENNFG